MLSQLKELYSLLIADQRNQLMRLQLLVLLMSFAEIAVVLSFGYFMAVVGDISQLQGNGFLAELYRTSGLSTPWDFLFWFGLSVFTVLIIATFISMYTVWRLSLYGNRVGAELSARLYHHYMHQDWLFHASGSSSQFTNHISQECQRITNAIITPLMHMNAKLVMASLMVVTVFLYNPLVALVGVSIFVSAYWLIYLIARRHLTLNGRQITEYQRHRFKLMGEGFGGIKDVLLLGKQDVLTRQFDAASQNLAVALGVNQALAQVPRYVMELVAFGSVIFLVLYLLISHEGNLGAILPMLSVYAMAGFKILPALQQVYSSITRIRGNLPAYEALRDDLRINLLQAQHQLSDDNHDVDKHWTPKKTIELRNVFFTYPGKQEPVLKNLSLEIQANNVVGLVGASGSGKSTAIDLLLGLIQPQSGEVLIDGQPLMAENLRSWQKSIGFVPQSIFLSDSSIRENIAFGMLPESIDDDKVHEVARMAHLDALLQELPDGIDTRVGERGVQLSGGQCQRIGIARALYHDADVLVLDEATSALDGISERLVMDAIHEFSGNKTIIMVAHRLATVKQCDCIYLMDDGQIKDQGSFEELAKNNSAFSRMADHAL